jgi:hypothetical protein
MATKKKNKTFDAVKMMREIREKISAETQNMSFDELKRYIEVRVQKNELHSPSAK